MIAALFAALLLAGLSALPGQSAEPEELGTPGFSGTWERDPDQSDDAQAKMQAAFERMQEEMERRGRGAPPVPGGPSPGDAGARREGRGGGPGQVPEELYVEHEDGELRLDDGERLQIFYLDGQKHRRAMPNGAKLETVATLTGRVVFIEEKLDRGKIERRLELSGDGDSMAITLNIKIGNMKEPVLIRTVYERLE